MVRKAGAMVLGVVTVGAVVMTLQQVSASFWPLPEGLDPFDPAQAEAWNAWLESMPAGAWALAMLSEVFGAFCGAVVAGWVARDGWKQAAGFVVGIALAFSIANWVSFTHPAWFIAGQVVLYPLAYLAAVKALSGRGAPAGEAAGA